MHESGRISGIVSGRLKARSTALALAIASALAACGGSSAPVAYDSTSAYTSTPDGLRRVKHWRFNDAFVRPGADLTGYDQVIIDDLTIEYKQPENSVDVNAEGIEPGTYKLTRTATKTIMASFGHAFARELVRGETFSVTDRAHPNALRVSGHIVNLVVYMPPYASLENASSLFLATRSDMTLILNVRDSVTGETLVRVADHSGIRFDGASGVLPANPVSTASGARSLFQRVAIRLRQQLEVIRALPEVPLPPDLSTANMHGYGR